MTGLIDTHTHLETFARAGTLDGILEHAAAARVEQMITIGTSSDDWTLYRDLTSRYGKSVRYTVGLHPCAVTPENWRDELAAMAPFWENSPGAPRPLAVGEIGLDRFHLPKDLVLAAPIFEAQKSAFREGLAFAKRLAAPMVIHSRGAFRECVELIDESGVEWSRVVFHCFTEGPAEMKALLERGGRGSFTGILTYKNAQPIRDAALLQGLDRFMLETDAPYLTPVPHRGKPNEPAFLRHTAEHAAQLFGVTTDELASRSSETARQFFGLQK